MNNEEKNYYRLSGLLRVLSFTLNALNRQLQNVQERIDFIYSETNGKGIAMPQDIGEEYETKRSQYNKLYNERNYVQYLINQLNAIIALPSVSNEDKFKQATSLLHDFFNEHQNEYAGFRGTGTILPGDSHFKQIMKDSELYGKLNNKIDELENSMKLLCVRRTMNNHNPSSYEKDLPYKLRDLRTKRTAIESKQKIIMLKRQQAINKKNKLISNLEGKATEYAYLGNNVSSDFYLNAARNLRNFPVVMLAPAPVVLLKERLVASFSRFKNLKYGKYDKHGNIDYRPWSTRRAEELEEKINKKL